MNSNLYGTIPVLIPIEDPAKAFPERSCLVKSESEIFPKVVYVAFKKATVNLLVGSVMLRNRTHSERRSEVAHTKTDKLTRMRVVSTSMSQKLRGADKVYYYL
jgi:hypothetical protein